MFLTLLNISPNTAWFGGGSSSNQSTKSSSWGGRSTQPARQSSWGGRSTQPARQSSWGGRSAQPAKTDRSLKMRSVDAAIEVISHAPQVKRALESGQYSTAAKIATDLARRNMQRFKLNESNIGKTVERALKLAQQGIGVAQMAGY